ncbi:serine hydrolase [Agrobacterium tumefaciens]|nr:serine hydrolase [Agrobacterium tumefaciens]NTE26345.1 serine hydrolase [Agrobacterium tumefaciens]
MKFINFNILFLLISFLSIAQVKEQALSKTQLATIDSLMNKILKDQNIAGFAVAVVKGDEVILSKGFGYRDIANKKPVTPNTLFAIGSSTKAFTASLIGLLQKDGKLDFDNKAIDYLPSLRFYSQEMNNQITVRDLMAHRTGLSRYDFSWLLFNTSNRDSIIHRVRFMQPTAPVRQKWLYNNFMYLAQGMIVEKLTGKTWEQNIQEKFFTPLQMTRSNTNIKTFENDSDASLPYVTTDENVIKKVDYYNIDGMGPAGSINSSVNDLANWLKVWISGGTYNKKEILPSSYIREAASSQMVIAPELPGEQADVFLGNYGFGWMISSYRGHYLVEHGGNINGFSANVAFFPSDKLGIVVLTNQNNSGVPNLVRSAIADQILNLKPIDWNGLAKKAGDQAKLAAKQLEKENIAKPILNTNPSHPLKDYIGSFENPAYGIIKVSLEKNTLFAAAGINRMFLKHLYYDVFDPQTVEKDGTIDTAKGKILINFISNQEGKIQSLSMPLDGNEKPVVFDIKAEDKILSVKELEKFTGEFSLGTTTTKVYVKGNKLYLFVPGQPEYETVYVDENKFNLKTLSGFSIKFDDFKDGKAGLLTFIQPNGVFKASRKK